MWGIPPEKLSSEFAKQRIKDFSLGEAIKQLFIKKNRHKTLVDQFAYPIGGNGYVYEKMLDLYLDNDGKILFNTKITSIIGQKNTFQIKFENIPTQEFDYVISSMPIDNFLHLFKNYTKNSWIEI